MDYFIYDAQVRLIEIREQLDDAALSAGDRKILTARANDLCKLISLYNGIKTNLHKNNLQNSVEITM